jgi:hypothetical protein
MYDSHIFNLKILINIILQEHLSKSATEIDVLAKEIKEYEVIQTIPGIGEKIAATIISEIGKIERFDISAPLNTKLNTLKKLSSLVLTIQCLDVNLRKVLIFFR